MVNPQSAPLSEASGGSGRKSWVLMVIGLLLLVLVKPYDASIAQRATFTLGDPDFSVLQLLKSAIIAIGSLLIVISIASARRPAGVLMPGETLKPGILHITALVISMVFVALYLLSPEVLTTMQFHEGPIEKLQAVFYLGAAGCFLYSAFKFWKAPQVMRRRLTLLSFLAAVFFFSMAGWEEAWGRKVVIDPNPPQSYTPADSEQVLQMVAKWKYLVVYYFGSFVWFVLLPFARGTTGLSSRLGRLSFFFPSRSDLLIGAIFVAYAGAYWNTPTSQAMFFMTVFIIGWYLWGDKTERSQSERRYLLVLLVCTIAAMAAFLLAAKERYIWRVVEYQEFFIPLAFLVYSIRRARNAGALGTNGMPERK